MMEVLSETEITNQNPKLMALATTINNNYEIQEVIGSGSFGTVYQAKNKETGEICAIKKVLQDKRYKNRELEILKDLDHINVIKLNYHYYTIDPKTDENYLMAVMDYIPDTLSKIIRKSDNNNKQMPLLHAKIYAFQMLRAINYLHTQGICHRDIKPQNILVNQKTFNLKICDFGSAKRLNTIDSNIAYICSRYYRAPELIFNSSFYTNMVDVWSIGCIIAELVLAFPIFPGNSAINQIVEIIKVLGTPSKVDIKGMNKNYKDFSFPVIRSFTNKEVFKDKEYTDDFIDLIKKLLKYNPEDRILPLDALLHPFFDELKIKSTKMPENNIHDILFNFSELEIKMDKKNIIQNIVPKWYNSNSKL